MLFLGWDVWTILIVYWLENGIVGIFNVAKMWLAEGVDDASTQTRINGRPIQGQAKGFLIPFFLVHYGIFWVVHGVFVLSFAAFATFRLDDGMFQGLDPVPDPDRSSPGRTPARSRSRRWPCSSGTERRSCSTTWGAASTARSQPPA